MVKSETPDPKHLQGYANEPTLMFSMTWNNDQTIYNDFVEHAAGYWIQERFSEHPEACGELIVTYARDWYTGAGDGHEGKNFFPDVNGAQWDEIDRKTVGEEIAEAMTNHGKYAHLLEPVPDNN